MKVIIIAALGQKGELGKDNQLLWHLHEDMQFFKRTTSGHYVIMGRKSFESIPTRYRPLPDRVNVIISRNPDYMYEECYTCASLAEAIDLARANGEEQVFVIGGGEIYRAALESNLIDGMFLTHVHATFPAAQVHFPNFEQQQWSKKTIQSFLADSQNEFAFDIVYYDKLNSSLNQNEETLSAEKNTPHT